MVNDSEKVRTIDDLAITFSTQHWCHHYWVTSLEVTSTVLDSSAGFTSTRITSIGVTGVDTSYSNN